MCGFTVFKSNQLTPTIKKYLDRIDYRGPDMAKTSEVSQHVFMDFRRLAIMDLEETGMQPFTEKGSSLVCNGEIYNFTQIKSEFLKEYEFASSSDCEVILPLYQKVGLETLVAKIQGEFAFVIWDQTIEKFVAARDPMGIRPLFYGHDESGEIVFSSEAKVLQAWTNDIKPFPPGHYFDGEIFVEYNDLAGTPENPMIDIEQAKTLIHDKLSLAVEQRLESDAPIGFLLSGGLDSSLVCAIAAKISKQPIRTFSVGISENPIDTKYAKIVSDYLGTDHTEVLFDKTDIVSHLSSLIYRLETYDITTIRASIGMDYICRYIKEKTDIKVIMTGECSDELFGYKYTDFAPCPEEFQKEAAKRIHEIYMYDVLRADRCISSNGLEARVPFGDPEFAESVIAIPGEMKMNFSGHGKYLLRAAFEKSDYLPKEILYREKAAFSDAVGHASVDFLKDLAELSISEDQLKMAFEKYPHATPLTKEAYLYRQLFEEHFPGQSRLVKDFWMPNKEWENCDVSDPSARALPNYGKSGS